MHVHEILGVEQTKAFAFGWSRICCAGREDVTRRAEAKRRSRPKGGLTSSEPGATSVRPPKNVIEAPSNFVRTLRVLGAHNGSAALRPAGNLIRIEDGGGWALRSWAQPELA